MQYLSILIIVAAIVFYIIWKKKKQKKELSRFVSNRKEKDEVWNTIKMYIREHDDSNKRGEIANHYVVRRNDVNYVNPNLSSYWKKRKRAEVKIRLEQEKNQTVPPKNDTYVVCYQTRDVKTKQYNPPKAFECEVRTIRLNKKESQQKVVITRSLNFDKEMEWIAPIRSLEAKKNERNEKILEKQRKKAAAKKQRKSKTKKD